MKCFTNIYLLESERVREKDEIKIKAKWGSSVKKENTGYDILFVKLFFPRETRSSPPQIWQIHQILVISESWIRNQSQNWNLLPIITKRNHRNILLKAHTLRFEFARHCFVGFIQMLPMFHYNHSQPKAFLLLSSPDRKNGENRISG